MNDKIKNVLNKATDYTGSSKRKFGKGILGVVIVILLGALGLEVGNKDFDIGSLLDGNSLSESEIVRDKDGNLTQDENGGFLTNILRDKLGNEVPAGTPGAKYTNEYNCDDFTTQKEAQNFFEKAGGVNKDTNRLDGDKNGVACQSLKKGN